MNKYVKRYFQEAKDDSDRGHFHKVILVDESVSWETVEPWAPRGWFELTRLDRESRIEFVAQFWQSKLTDAPAFFERVDDITLFLAQKPGEEHFTAHLVYSLQEDAGFYQGSPPHAESVIENHSLFHGIPLPRDYLAFQGIHAHFGKNADRGLYSVRELEDGWKLLQRFLKEREPVLFYDGEEVDGKKLIPFYNSFGRYSWQCFCADWYPEEEMGNVAVSHETVFLPMLRAAAEEGLAFASFLDWLAFYLTDALEV